MPAETLHIVTLAICIFTLVLAAAALLPQLKRAIVLVRDAMLMSALVLVLSFAGFIGWGKVFELREQRQRDKPTQDPFAITELFDPAPQEQLDPLPLPSILDEVPVQRRPAIGSQAQIAASANTNSPDTDNRGWGQ